MADYIDWAKFEEGIKGLHDLRYLERKMAERAAKTVYNPVPKADDYASRMMRASLMNSVNPNSSNFNSLSYGHARKDVSYRSASSAPLTSYSDSTSQLSTHQIYSANPSSQKTFCCGRRNAGPQMQCGSCPLR